MKRFTLPVLALVLLGGIGWGAELPRPAGFVTDTVNLLTPEQRQEIGSELKAYEAKTGTEIAIVIVANTQGMQTADYATKIGNTWGVGKKGVDNGAVVLVVTETRNIWIAVGRQLEGALTDGQCGAIIRKVIKPRFKEGNFHAGLKEGVLAIEKTISGEIFTEERMAHRSRGGTPPGQLSLFIVSFAVIGLSWLAAILGRTKEIWPGGAIGAIAGAATTYFTGFSWLAIGIVTICAGLLGLAFDWVVSRNYKKFTGGGGPTPPWWMGGSGFGGGSSGGGFGGFGGGGFSGGGGGDRW